MFPAENRRNVTANLQSHEDEVEAENIVYPMRPERIESIRRWASDVGREQSRQNVQSSGRIHSGVGTFSSEQFTASSESDEISVSSEDEDDIADRLDRAALLLNLKNSNVHHTKPPSFTRSRPPGPASVNTTQIQRGPRATVKTSVFQDVHGLSLGEGTSVYNVGGSVRVTRRQDGGTVRETVIVNDGRNTTVFNSVNGRPIGPPREHNPLKTHHDASGFQHRERTFNYDRQPHSPDYNQGSQNLNTLNALPKGLPPRHLRGKQNRNPNYIIPHWG